MRLKELLTEVRKNIISGVAHSLRYTAALTLILTLCCFYELTTISSIIESANRYKDSGSGTYIISNPGKISGANCEALNKLDGVIAAGALSAQKEKFPVIALPSAPIPVYNISKSAYKLFSDIPPSIPGVYAPDSLANSLNLQVGSKLISAHESAIVAGIYNWPDDGRRPGYDYAILSPIDSSSTFDECWVESWPMLDQVGNVLRTTLKTAESDSAAAAKQKAENGKKTDEEGDKTNIYQLNSSNGFTFSGLEEYNERTTQDIWLIAFLAAFIIGSISIFLRRIEFASGLHAGLKKSELLLQNILEALSWILPSAVISLPVIFYFAIFKSSGDSAALANAAFQIVTAGAVGGLCGIVFGISTVREKNLFKYFKDR